MEGIDGASLIFLTQGVDKGHFPSIAVECTYRRILLFPFGNSNAPPNDTVSVYLDYADPKRAPEGWHACAQFALVISNPTDPTIYTVSRTRFCCIHTRVHRGIAPDD